VRGVGALPKSPRLKDTVFHTVFESIGRQFLRHEADHDRAAAGSGEDVVTVHPMLPSLGLTIPQMMPISVVFPAPLGPEQREDLSRRMSS